MANQNKKAMEKMTAVYCLRSLAGQQISVKYISDTRVMVFAGYKDITSLINTILDRKVSLMKNGVYVHGGSYDESKHRYIIELVNFECARLDKAENPHNYIFDSDCIVNRDYIVNKTKRKASRF